MSINGFEKLLISSDRVLDYIPVVSALSNLIDIFQKCVVMPLLDSESIQKSHYYTHLQNKGIFRCAMLLIPLVGNIIMPIYDFCVKNPFSISRKLGDLWIKDTDFKPEAMMVGENSVAINMDQLKSLSQGIEIKREDLPKEATLTAFEDITNKLEYKVAQGGEIAELALEGLGTTWAQIQTPIWLDPNQYLKQQLAPSDDAYVSEEEAKWRAVLSNILAKDTSPRKGYFFTEQEEVFIKTMMGIQNCGPAKKLGIASSYEQLDPEYHYKITLSKPNSLEEDKEKEEVNKALNFIKEFVENSTKVQRSQGDANNLDSLKKIHGLFSLVGDMSYWDRVEIEGEDKETCDLKLNEAGKLKLSTDLEEVDNLPEAMDEDLTAYIETVVNGLKNYINSSNESRNRTAIVNVLIQEEEYWNEDVDKLNGNGALQLITIFEKNQKIEAEKNALQFVAQSVRKLMEAQFTGTNELMQVLTETNFIEQGAHQAIYLKNLIGHLTGVSREIIYDPYTLLLYNKLIARDRDEVLAIFFSFMTPQVLVKEMIRAINQSSEKDKILLKSLLENKFWVDEQLEEEGVVALLKKAGYLID